MAPPIYQGTTELSKVYLQNTEMSTVYVGTTQIYPSNVFPNDYVLWLDSSTITGLSDGQSINNSSLIDKSSNNYVTTQVNSPLYKTGGLNNLPYVLFNGTNQGLYIDNFSILPSSQTIYMVFNNLSAISVGTALESTSAAYANTGGLGIYCYDSLAITSASNNGSYTGYTANNQSWIKNGKILTCVNEWINATSKPILKTNYATPNLTPVNQAANPPVTTNVITFLNLFASNRVTRNYLSGQFYEVIFYNRILTNTEQIQVYSYLSTKYGI